MVYNDVDEIIWVSQTTLVKKEDVLGQKNYDLKVLFRPYRHVFHIIRL